MTSSTSAITTLEFEPGLIADFRKSLEIIAPVNGFYAHDEKLARRQRFFSYTLFIDRHVKDHTRCVKIYDDGNLAAGDFSGF